jgi:hypothetical protein
MLTTTDRAAAADAASRWPKNKAHFFITGTGRRVLHESTAVQVLARWPTAIESASPEVVVAHRRGEVTSDGIRRAFSDLMRFCQDRKLKLPEPARPGPGSPRRPAAKLMTLEQQKQARYRELFADHNNEVHGVTLKESPARKGRAHFILIGDPMSLCGKTSWSDGIVPARETALICAACARVAQSNLEGVRLERTAMQNGAVPESLKLRAEVWNRCKEIMGGATLRSLCGGIQLTRHAFANGSSHPVCGAGIEIGLTSPVMDLWPSCPECRAALCRIYVDGERKGCS